MSTIRSEVKVGRQFAGYIKNIVSCLIEYHVIMIGLDEMMSCVLSLFLSTRMLQFICVIIPERCVP